MAPSTLSAGIVLTIPNTGIVSSKNGPFDLNEPLGVINNGTIITNDGRFGSALTFGAIGISANLVNNRLIEADKGTSLALHSPRAFDSHYGNIINAGVIKARGGIVELDAPLIQKGAGQVLIENHGTVVLDCASDGGSIKIMSGMLDFEGFSRVAYGPTAARSFHSDVSLIGADATFKFGANGTVSEVFTSLGVGKGDLQVFDASHRSLADIHLTGNYTAAQFKAHSNMVDFIAHPVVALPV